jgi:hypothetical protein
MSVASFSPDVESSFRFGGSGQCDEIPSDAIDEASAEWAALQAQQERDGMESRIRPPRHATLPPLAERDRLLAQLPWAAWCRSTGLHEWSSLDGVRTLPLAGRWCGRRCPALTDPSACAGVGSHEQSLTAAGDMALSDLRTKAVASISQASGVLPAGHPVSLVAVVAAEGRAA